MNWMWRPPFHTETMKIKVVISSSSYIENNNSVGSKTINEVTPPLSLLIMMIVFGTCNTAQENLR